MFQCDVLKVEHICKTCFNALGNFLPFKKLSLLCANDIVCYRYRVLLG